MGVGCGGIGIPTLREGLVGGEGTGIAEREGRAEGVGRTEITNELLTDGRLIMISVQQAICMFIDIHTGLARS